MLKMMLNIILRKLPSHHEEISVMNDFLAIFFLLPSNNMQIILQHYNIVNISRLALGFPYTHMSNTYNYF